MIIDSFDDKSEAIINPKITDNLIEVDACIVTFSYVIEKYVLENFDCKKIGEFKFSTGITPVYQIDYNNKKFAFYKTYVGAPACVGSIEDTLAVIKTKKYIVFGGAGCLDKEIAHGKIMIPTEAYRDEGTSYHYAKAEDYIKIRNFAKVEEFMKVKNIPYVLGKTWTTDSFFRETKNNFEKRKSEGCISVDMECSAIQAMSDFRGLEFYTFFASGDLLDAPEWDERKVEDEYKGTQHDYRYFDIAIKLASYITD